MGWKEKEAEVLDRLEKTLSEEDWDWLQKAVNFDAGDLEEASTADIEKCFQSTGKADKNRVNDARLLRTMIWQSWIKIQAECQEPVQGNVRSYWYQTVEPFYRQHHLLGDDLRVDSPEQNTVETMTALFGDFVRHHIFEYQGDFQFQRPIDAKAQVGKDKAKFLFYTEKEGLWWLCRQMIDGDAGTSSKLSGMASNGQPSFVTLEYFARDLQRARVGNLVVGAFTDYDLYGLQIAEQIDAKMRFLGFKSVTTYRLTTVDLFTEEQIAKGKSFENVTGGLVSQVEHWMEQTGGCYGKKIGLHIDVIPRGQKQILAKKFRNGADNNTLDQLFPRVMPVDLRRYEKPGRQFA